MVVVYVQVALARELERHARVLRQSMVHLSEATYRQLHSKSMLAHSAARETYVIQEADPGGDGDLLLVPRAGLAVQVDRDADLGLVRLALDRRCPRCHLRAFAVGYRW